LAEHTRGALGEVDVAQLHARALADAAAGRVQHLEDRTIALSLRRLVERLAQQRVDLGRRQEARHAARRARALQQLRGVLADAARALQPVEQAAQARELALHGRRDEPTLLELDEIAAQLEARDRGQVARQLREPRDERAQVAAV